MFFLTSIQFNLTLNPCDCVFLNFYLAISDGEFLIILKLTFSVLIFNTFFSRKLNGIATGLLQIMGAFAPFPLETQQNDRALCRL